MPRAVAPREHPASAAGYRCTARRWGWIGPEVDAMTREGIEALVARERPGWRVIDVTEVNDESGPSFEVTVEDGGGRAVVLLVAEDERIAGERPTAREGEAGRENMEIIARKERERGAWGIDEA
jgi:hypothetical protein